MPRQIYIALLRGINVGGHHKVPMAALRKEMEVLEFSTVTTLLNSGNVIFEGETSQTPLLEKTIAEHLEKVFGFAIPVWVIKGQEIAALIQIDPFQQIEVTKDRRLYVSFLKESPRVNLDLPWVSEDKSYQIISIQNRIICSVLDLSDGTTVSGMDALEKLFGKAITTRNWNTILRIGNKID